MLIHSNYNIILRKTMKYKITRELLISRTDMPPHCDYLHILSSNPIRTNLKMTHCSWELAIYLVISKSYICLMKVQPKEGHPQERRAGLGFL